MNFKNINHGKALLPFIGKSLKHTLLAMLMTTVAFAGAAPTSTPTSPFQDLAAPRRSVADEINVRTEDGLRQVFAKIFATYPSARNLVSSQHLAQAASILFGPAAAAEIHRVLEQDKGRFNAARQKALKEVPIKSNGKTFVVSGLSASGVAAAMVAANAGYQVIGYEARSEYTRNIQWTARQCIIDTLALINQDMSDRFVTQVIRPISIETDLVDSKPKTILQLNPPRRGDPAEVPNTPGNMLNQDTVMILQTKMVERFLMSELQKVPNVHIQVGKTIQLRPEGNQYAIENLGTPDLVVVAEGSGSKTRKALGIPHAPTSRTRLQIAGELMIERNGGLSFNEEHIIDADGKPNILLTSAISTQGSGANWTVTDVPPHVNLEPKGLTPGTEEYKVKKQALVNEYYIGALARVLQKSPSEIRRLKINGPIENTPPTPFSLQQNMSKTAVYGTNTVAIGDTVGNAHWNVGGGVHIAIVSHIRRLSELIFDLEIGRDRLEALSDYDEKVKLDSLEWGRRGIVDFYPGYDPEIVKKNFDKAVRTWMRRANPTKSPLDLLEGALAKHQKVSAKGKPVSEGSAPLRCEAIFR